MLAYSGLPLNDVKKKSPALSRGAFSIVPVERVYELLCYRNSSI